MAQDGERSAPADKGKGKVDDIKELSGGKKTAADEKPQADGKQKDDESKEGRWTCRVRPRTFRRRT